MSVESSGNAKDIFLAATEIASVKDRETFLNDACGGNVQLRHRVDALIMAHESPESLLNYAAPHLDADRSTEVATARSIGAHAGSQIGPYKLRERLGEGGMGVVWAAEQKQPLRRKVALKLIKPGMDSQQVLARFEAEREALALMDHPNIARVVDAGTTDRGLPYFVMELIHGVPITEYCDRQCLTVPERLRIFVAVCKAIQHAHQKGIIHRDIKPSNVLITEQDGEPVPKVIDFGVAKALHQPLTERSIYTGVFQAIGTLAYMSPEQAAVSSNDVDTRSDIYGLAVLLFELLTGTTPFERQELEQTALDEALRMIREQDAPTPSMRLSMLGDRMASVSKVRRTDPASLSKSVHGDLDWIVMKALDKNRARRYETANDFASDIQRFLTEKPVEARPPSRLYRLSKYIKRNRAVVVATAVICCLLVGFAITIIHSEIQSSRFRVALREDSMEKVNLHVWAGEFVSAQLELENARSLGADDGWYWLHRGQIAMHQGRYLEARSYLQKAADEWPDSTAVASISLIADRYAGYEHAYLLGAGKLKDRPAVTFEDYLFRGLAQSEAHPDLAVDDLEQARSMKPNSALVRLLKGNALRLQAADTISIEQGRLKAERALEQANEARDMLPNNSVAAAEVIHANILCANIYERLGTPFTAARQKCIEQARSVVEQSNDLPYDYQAHLARIYFHDQLGSEEAYAQELFDTKGRHTAINEHDFVIVFRRAWQKYRDGDFHSALAEFNSAEGLFAHKHQLFFPAFIEMSVSNDVEALRAKYKPLMLEEGRDANGIFAHHDWAIARLLRSESIAKQRGVVFRRLCDSIPLDVATQHRPTGDYMSGIIDNATAEALLRQQAVSNRVLVEAYFALGVGHLADGHRSEAKRLFEACLSTGYYEWFVYWWAEAFLETLEDPTWLPWLPNDGSLSSG